MQGYKTWTNDLASFGVRKAVIAVVGMFAFLPLIGCGPVVCEDDAICDDGVFCNGAETCDIAEGETEGVCVDGTEPCAADECDEDTDTCPVICETDADCDDSDVCTTDTCGDDGACDNAAIDACCNTDADCADGEVCVNNACTTACADATDCDDGDACNGDETCDADDAAADAAGCVAGTALDCDDSDDCTDDSCDSATGCVNADVTCDAGETCVGGTCVEACTVAGDCDDSNLCTVDTCESDVCVHTAVDCDDDLFCTGTESCNTDTGACEATGDPCAADVDNPICDEDNDVCVAEECVDDVDCDDTVACTDDTCTASVCTSTDNCTGGEMCDMVADAGTCVECLTSDDCGAGFICTAANVCEGTDPPFTFDLTIASDTFTGGTGNDTFNGPASSDIQTLNSGDTLDGGAGTDTLFANMRNALTTPAELAGIEILQLNATANTPVLDLVDAGTTTITTIESLASSSNLTINNLNQDPADLAGGTIKLSNTNAANFTLEFKDAQLTGGSDALTFQLDGVAGATTIMVGGDTDADGDIETATINCIGGTSDLGTGSFDLDDVTGVTVNATANCDLGSTASFPDATTWTALGSAGNVTCVFANKTAAGTDVAITGGDGDDNFDISNFTANADPTIDLGAGDDTIVVDGSALVLDYRVDGGAGDSDVISTDGDLAATATLDLMFTNFERLTVTGVAGGAVAQDMDDLPGIDFFSLNVDGDLTLTNMVNGATLRVNNDNNNTIDIGGAPGVNAFTLQMDIDAGGALGDLDDSANVQSLVINATGDAAQAIEDMSGVTTTTALTIIGTSDLDLNDTALAANIVVVNAGAFSGILTVETGNTTTATIITGGSDDDVITIDDATSTDVITGGLGQDTVDLDGVGNTVQTVKFMGPNDGADVPGLASGSLTDINAGDTYDDFELNADLLQFDQSAFTTLTGDGTVAVIATDTGGTADFDLSTTTSVFILDDDAYAYGAGNELVLANLQAIFADELSNVTVGEQAIFIIGDAGAVGDFGVYLFTATDTDDDLDADEIQCLGVFQEDTAGGDLTAILGEVSFF